MEFEAPFIEALQQAVTPSEADVAIARGVVLDAVTHADEPALVTDFEDAWLKAQGGRRPAERTQYQAVASTQNGRRLADPDPTDPHLMEFRCRHAVRRAIAQLIAEGVIAKGEGNQYPIQPERIPVQYPGGGSSAPVLVHSPYIGDYGSTPRFMAVRPAAHDTVDVLLPIGEMIADLDAVLGPRGMQLVRESRRSLQRGLFLAALSLLAAASAAAWFNLARTVPQPGAKLQTLITGGRDLAEVIRLTEQHLQGIGRGRSLITEVVSQAHLFREIRNYALHPVEEHDTDREAWLTETGATLLAIAARRYFVKLAGLQTQLAARGPDGSTP